MISFRITYIQVNVIQSWPRTTDTQWKHKSQISEKLGRCGRQNMLRPYLNIWEWEWIFGRAVKATFSLGVRSPCSFPSLAKVRPLFYLCCSIVKWFYKSHGSSNHIKLQLLVDIAVFLTFQFSFQISNMIEKKITKYSDLDFRGYLKKHDPIRYHRCYFNPVSCFGHFVKNERMFKKRLSRFSIRWL